MRKIVIIGIILIVTLIITGCWSNDKSDILPPYKLNDQHISGKSHTLFLVVPKNLTTEDAYKIINRFRNQYPNSVLMNIYMMCDERYARYNNGMFMTDNEFDGHNLYAYFYSNFGGNIEEDLKNMGCASTITLQERIAQQKQEIQEITKEYPIKIETLSDFENSAFCETYNCIKKNSWALRTGGTNNVYENIIPTVSFEIVSDNSNVISAGIVFYYRNKLSNDDLQMVYDFLKSVDTEKDLSEIKPYVSVNVENKVSQIMLATPTTFGSFKVYAGKVGREQIVHLEK